MRRALENRGRYEVAHRILLPGGQVRYVHEQGKAKCGSTGQPPTIIGTVRDITEQKSAEDALRTSSAMLSGILTISEEAVILADGEMRIILFSRGAERVFGYRAQEAIGLGIEQLIPQLFHAAHRKHIADFAAGGEMSRRR